jgi:hypothetical protein
MTLGDPKKGFTAYPLEGDQSDVRTPHGRNESGYMAAILKIAAEHPKEVKLFIPDTFNIACPELGTVDLVGPTYRIQVTKLDAEQVVLQIRQKPDGSQYPLNQPLKAKWLNQPFTRHLLGLSCTCKNHCSECRAPLRYSVEWAGTRFQNTCPNPECKRFVPLPVQ